MRPVGSSAVRTHVARGRVHDPHQCRHVGGTQEGGGHDTDCRGHRVGVATEPGVDQSAGPAHRESDPLDSTQQLWTTIAQVREQSPPGGDHAQQEHRQRGRSLKRGGLDDEESEAIHVLAHDIAEGSEHRLGPFLCRDKRFVGAGHEV